MLAVFVNAGAVLLAGLLGLALHGRLQERHTRTIVMALGLCTMVIGVTSAIETANILVVILSLVFGTALGEALKLEQRMDDLGEWLRKRFAQNGSARFTEGFLTASLLFCVGSMSVLGSFDAGLRGDYTTIFAKSALDAVMAVTFAATMGVGVLFSALTILIYQGALTLLAGVVEPWLSAVALTELAAVGGVMLMGTGINILGMSKERIRVGNMLPALLLPPLWFALRRIF